MYRSGLKISGDSAGAVIALMIALGMPPTELDRIYRRVSQQCHDTQPWYNPFNHTGSSVFMERALREDILPPTDPTAYQRLHGIAYFGTTEFPYTHRWHMRWNR